MSPSTVDYQVLSSPSPYGPNLTATKPGVGAHHPYLGASEPNLSLHHQHRMPEMFSNLNSSQHLLGVAPHTADRNTKRELAGGEHPLFKDNPRSVELGALLHRVQRVLTQVAGSQREQELKDFFQNIRKSKEPNLCKESCPSSENCTSSSKDGGLDLPGLSLCQRHSFTKMWKRHAKKRQKKEVNSSENTHVKNDLNTSERLKDPSSIPSISVSSSPDGEARPDQAGGTVSTCPPSPDNLVPCLCADTSLESLLIGDASPPSEANTSKCSVPTSTSSQYQNRSCLKHSHSCPQDSSTCDYHSDTVSQPNNTHSSLDVRCPPPHLTASTKSASDSRLFAPGSKAAGIAPPNMQESSCCCQEEENMSLLQKLAYNALNLTAPASSLLLNERRNNWVQLSGHPGSLAPAGPGTIWKKRDLESTETDMYRALMLDPAARSIVPTFFREIEYGDDHFIEMRDLLYTFNNPSIMDIKMGTRTFLEGEVSNAKPRQDLYQKMVKVSPDEPTPEEREAGAVTKLRYMHFRDTLSSSRDLGFRIEAMKMHGSPAVTDLKTVRCRQEVVETMTSFMRSRDSVRRHVLEKLYLLRDGFERSDFFSRHEVIGSSILLVFDDDKAGIWIIDFAKTRLLPEDVFVTHRDPWVMGNHEEGFLFGLDNLIEVVKDLKMSKIRKLSFLRSC